LLTTGGSPKALVESKGLIAIADPAAIAEIVDRVIADNPKQLAQYKGGQTKLMGYFVGQVMKVSNGRADAKLTNQIVAEKLNG
jgi:aspartyl-tRNA(Asn)/glutamyl-tRNA(Gln) amidotransferase subunit B